MSEGEVREEQFRVLEGVVYFVDPKSPFSFSYLGGKETISTRISSHVAPYKGGIVFVDTEGRQIKAKIPSEKGTVIGGAGSEGNSNGKAENARFSQPMGICVECDKNIFVTDAQTGAVKLVTTIKGTKTFGTSLQSVLYPFKTPKGRKALFR